MFIDLELILGPKVDLDVLEVDARHIRATQGTCSIVKRSTCTDVLDIDVRYIQVTSATSKIVHRLSQMCRTSMSVTSR